MTKLISKTLDADDLFPSIQFNLIDGTSLTFPEDAGNKYSLLLVYRGTW